MGIAAVKIKILPTSTDVDLEELKATICSMIEEKGGKNCKIDQEPLAFGLEALIAFFAWPEEQELESLEQEINALEKVSTVQVVDMRRAFG